VGYYTEYKLEATEWPDELSKYLYQNFYSVDKYGGSVGDCKWYDHEKDMRTLSLQFSDIHFTLYGEGEKSGDIWKKHFLNGKMQLCNATITFEEFDPSKLE